MIKIVLICVLLLPILPFDPALFSFLILGFAPSVIWLMLDNKPGKPVGMTIFFFNAAGMCLYLIPMFERFGANKLPEVLSVMKIFFVLTMTCTGYFISWIVPRLFVIYADYKNQNRARIISEKMAKLIDEWGAEVRP